MLGWAKYKNEMCHKPNLSIGSSGHIQPDILIQKDNKPQFVIEVKRPSHTQRADDCNQLKSYIRQLRLPVGIYIGEFIELFYDKPDGDGLVSVLTIPLELDNKRGARFIELFSKERFSRENIVQFCEERIKEMRHQESLNKIKEKLVGDAQNQIAEGMKMFLMEKYGNTFSESDIIGMLSSLDFSATPKGHKQTVSASPHKILPQKPQTTKTQHDKTQYSINGGSFRNKRRFVHQLVKLYAGQHPSATFTELEQVFTPDLQGSYGVIRTTSYIRERGIEEFRYLMKGDELLHDAENTAFAVCSQWGIKNTPKIVDLAKKLGYVIKTSEGNPTQVVPQIEPQKEGEIRCFLTRNANAKGLFNISTQALTVLKGSTINLNTLDKVSPAIKVKREAQIAEYTERRGDELVVVKDATFNTPSGAAVFCVGGSSNGWIEWKDEKNNELGIYRHN